MDAQGGGQETVGRYLAKEEAAVCEGWITNDRFLRELLARLEAIRIERLEAARHSE